MSWSSQMSSEPRVFSAAVYSFQLVVRYFDLAGAIFLSVYPSVDAGDAGGAEEFSRINTQIPRATRI